MTYTNPKLVALGKASSLILGIGGPYAEFETDQVGDQTPRQLDCPENEVKLISGDCVEL